MSRLSRLLNSGVSFAAVTVARSIAMLVLLPFITRLLSTSEYAQIVLVTPFWWLGQSLFSLGASEGIARSVAGRSRRYGGASYLAAVMITVGTGFVSLGLQRGLFAVDLGGVESRVVSLSIVLGTSQAVAAVGASVLRGTFRNSSAAAVLLITGVVAPLAAIAALFVEPTAAAYIIGLIVCTTVGAALGGALVLAAGVEKLTLSEVLDPIKIGLPALPSAAAALGLEGGIRSLVYVASGPTGTAVIGVASATGGSLWNVVRSVGLAWAPKIYTYAPTVLRARLSRQLHYATAACIAALGVGAVLAGVFDSVLLPPPVDRTNFILAVVGFGAAGVSGVTFFGISQLFYRERQTGLLSILVLAVFSTTLGTFWAVSDAMPFAAFSLVQPVAFLFASVALWGVARARGFVVPRLSPAFYVAPALVLHWLSGRVVLDTWGPWSIALVLIAYAAGLVWVGRSIRFGQVRP